MNDMTVEVLRIVNVVLVVVCIVGMVPLRTWWSAQAAPARFLLLALVGMILAAGYGSLESLWACVPGGARTAVYTVALIWATTGILLLHHHRKARHELPPHE